MSKLVQALDYKLPFLSLRDTHIQVKDLVDVNRELFSEEAVVGPSLFAYPAVDIFY